ncbi:MAG TPA: DNA polymerase III subunit gamma/tau [Solirubrobacteraceae bacterium]|nr:DNA polymerase III subunit gamma/tau [Solirubrobacteraceae bacterium]
MSAGPSLYRRHRPRTFADVVGQEHVVRTLAHAVERDKVHHAYLFVGSRGTGKTSMAKILASCLNCVNGPTITPCGECDSCVSIANATSLDVIEMDAASNNSVDDIRELRETVAYAPVSGRSKVYILDEAHMLSSQAWNAFLKTLEEPPPHTVFVLATTEANKVLPTVVDRCHRFDFGRPGADQIAGLLRRVAAQEQIPLQEGAAALIARHATGSFRDALGTLEQLVDYVGDAPIQPADVLAVLGVADAEALFAAVEAIIARDPAAALGAAATLTGSGRDPGQILRDLESHARELLSVQIIGQVPAELSITPDRDARLIAQARALAATDAVRILDLVSAALEASANGAHPRIQLELVLVRAAAPEFDPSMAALLSRIERLEQGGATRAAVVAPSAVAPLSAPPAAPSGAAPAPAPASDSAQPGFADWADRELVADPGTHGGEPSSTGARAADKTAAHPVGDEVAGVPALRIEPEPEPETRAQHGGAPSVAGTVQPATDLGQMIELWPAVVELVRGQNAMLASLLELATPVGLAQGELSLALPPGAMFHKRKAESTEHRQMAAAAVRSVTGTEFELTYRLAEPVEVATPAVPVDDTLSEAELVRRFVETFDAQELTDQEIP